MGTEEAKVSLGKQLHMSVTASVRTNLSIHHILAAALFSRLSARIERDNTNKLLSEELATEHRAYVVGAVIAAVASMESYINEVYLDAVEKILRTFKGLDPRIPELLAELWLTMERAPILHKYQVALIASGKPKFNRGQPPYQGADSLIKLRDALVHYKPEWDTDQRIHRNIEHRLRSGFKLNPFAPTNAAFFPKRCLGHGCAQWAVATSLQFIEDFSSRMGLSPRFGSRQSRLETQ